MDARTMAFASRGSVEIWARRLPRVVRASRWSSTPARVAREGVSSSSKQETSGSQLLWASARRILPRLDYWV